MAHFEVKSRRTIIDQKSGNDKTITEAFFIENCTSWADAEDKMLGYFNSENEVVGMAISKVMEVVNTPTQEEKMDMFVYRAVIASLYTDDDGNEKEMKYPVLLWAKSIDEAMDIVKGYIAQGLDGMSLVSITKTKIVEVI
jgi:hypothetical protein